MLPAATTLTIERKQVYEVPAGMTATITRLNVANRDTSLRLVNVFVVVRGQAKQLCPVNLEMPPGYQGIEESPLQLSAGDRIDAEADGDGWVDIFIGGKEEKV